VGQAQLAGKDACRLAPLEKKKPSMNEGFFSVLAERVTLVLRMKILSPVRPIHLSIYLLAYPVRSTLCA
jgi:hypothetical protein